MNAHIYVDDIIFGGMSNKMVEYFVQQTHTEFEMSLAGELTYFLGFQVKQIRELIFTPRSKCAKNIVKKCGLESARHKCTTTATHINLERDYQGNNMDQSLYIGMIGILLYLAASRPDITLSMRVCACYQSKPKFSHLAKVKRIIKYINGTSDYGIMYSHDTNDIMVGYSDVDYARNVEDTKSTSGGCFFLGTNMIYWFNKKQNCVSLSTAEAEYIDACNSCTQLLWMKHMLKEYNVKQDVMTLYYKNMQAINISKNLVQHNRTQHIDIHHHFIRELVDDKLITLDHVTNENQLADIFAKAMDVSQFKKLISTIGLCIIENLRLHGIYCMFSFSLMAIMTQARAPPIT